MSKTARALSPKHSSRPKRGDGDHSHRLPHAVVDDRPAAGDAANTMVTELQLQSASPQAQDNPGAVLMASSKEENAFGVKGPEVKLRHQSEHQHQETNQL